MLISPRMQQTNYSSTQENTRVKTNTNDTGTLDCRDYRHMENVRISYSTFDIVDSIAAIIFTRKKRWKEICTAETDHTYW